MAGSFLKIKGKLQILNSEGKITVEVESRGIYVIIPSYFMDGIPKYLCARMVRTRETEAQLRSRTTGNKFH